LIFGVAIKTLAKSSEATEWPAGIEMGRFARPSSFASGRRISDGMILLGISQLGEGIPPGK
jgi:hypothetical protein